MKSFLLFLLAGLGVWLAVSGGRKRQWLRLFSGLLLMAAAVFFYWFFDFWAELFWFEALGYGERYWDVFIVQALAATGSAVFSAAAIFCFTWGFSADKRWVRYGAIVLATLAGFHWGYSHWETILKFIHAAPTEQVDPIFGKAVGFYLFQLPMIDAVLAFLFLLAGLALVACALDAFFQLRFDASLELDARMNTARAGAVYRAAGILLIVMAAGKYVERFHLLY